jgi:hypothetical protein
MAEPRHARAGDSKQERRELRFRILRWGSPKVKPLSENFFTNPSRETASYLKEQLEKELIQAGRFRFRPSLTPLWLVAYIALGITVTFASYLLIKYDISQGSANNYKRNPSVATSTLHSEISPGPGPVPAKLDKRRPRKEVHQRPTSQATTTPSARPSIPKTGIHHALACVSCVLGGVSETLNKTVQTVQGVLNPLGELPPELVQSVGQDVLGPLLAPRSATSTEASNSPG